MDQTLSSKNDILMIPLTKFYKNKNNMKKMMKIIMGKSKISLRILDWFVTNYSKKRNIMYNITDRDNIKNFNVYLDYKSQLKAYTKRQFDPFCRNERIEFCDHDDNKINTTVGQLNFFRWAIENMVLNYVDDHLDEIEKDMNVCIRNQYGDKDSADKDDNKKKRHELSISAVKTINKHNIKIVVKFD